MGQVVFNQPTFTFDPVPLLLWIGIAICLFFILREVFCWYWKINKIVDSLEDIKSILRATNKLLSSTQQETPAPSSNAPAKMENMQSKA